MNKSRTLLDLDRYVPALITFVSNKLARGASATYRRLFGIGVTESRIMAQLAIEPGISANRICQVIGFDKALVSRSLGLLAKHGYVSISPDARDSRRRAIELTSRGLALYDRVVRVALERERRPLSGIDQAEIEALIGLLRRMHAEVAAVNAYDPAGTVAPDRAKAKLAEAAE